ncbi:ribonuclease H-like domain-containing protein [Tanacetum coccineum]
MINTPYSMGVDTPYFNLAEWYNNQDKVVVGSNVYTVGERVRLGLELKLRLLWRKNKNRIKADHYTKHDSPDEAKNHPPPPRVWGDRTQDEWNELVDWWSHPNRVSRSLQNAANRAKNTILTHQGKKSFAQGRNEYKVEKGHYEDLIETWRKGHSSKKTGEFKTEQNKQRYLDMKAMQEMIKAGIIPFKKSWMKSFRVTTARICRAWAGSYRVKYAMELLKRANMLNCNSTRTSVDTESMLGPEGVPISNPTLYQSLAGGLQYLTFTHPDLYYVVQHICLYIHDPREPHLASLKRIVCYVHGTLVFGLQLYASSLSSLVAYSDVDNPLFLRSSAEAEYRGVANVVAKTPWLHNLLWELHTPLLAATLVYCDNVSDVYLSANPVQHQQTKHIEIDIHFVCDMVAMGYVCVLHVSSHCQYADIFIKCLPSALFE